MIRIVIISSKDSVPKSDKFVTSSERARDMPDLDSEESAAQRNNKKRPGLKILTLDQMLSTLSITLAQLQAGAKSKKLKNKIRQLLYSLFTLKRINQKNL